jgi:hypothetical protein
MLWCNRLWAPEPVWVVVVNAKLVSSITLDMRAMLLTHGKLGVCTCAGVHAMYNHLTDLTVL